VRRSKFVVEGASQLLPQGLKLSCRQFGDRLGFG
jgi:hypothetical protein